MTRDGIIKILDRAMQRYVERNQQLFLSKGKTDKEMWEELEAIKQCAVYSLTLAAGRELP